ncbi:MAG: sulfotransferase family 2 domain-containing protein [Erythrobacter sp.]
MAIRIKGTRMVYFPVPKIACTSIKAAIIKQEEPDIYDKLESLGKIHTGRYTTVEFSKVRLRWRLFSRPVCVVRDPISRFVSGYRNRILHHDDMGGIQPSIDEFALNLSAHIESFAAVRHHFSPMTLFLGENSNFYEHIFDISEVDRLFDYLGVASVGRKQTGGPKIERDALSETAISHLKKFYAEDFDVYGEYFKQGE